MSEDKLKQSIAILPEFALGEMPSGGKLSESFRQINSALGAVEGAIGPIRDNGALPLNNSNINISNIARHLGPAGAIQPKTPTGYLDTFESTELETGLNEWRIPVWPFMYDATGLVGPFLTFNGTFIDTNGDRMFLTQQTDPAEPLCAAAEWRYNQITNNVESFSKLVAYTGTVQIVGQVGIEGEVNLEGPYMCYQGYGNASPNVIPSPDIPNPTSVTVEESSLGSTGEYVVTISPIEDIPSWSPVVNTAGSSYVGTALEALDTQYASFAGMKGHFSTSLYDQKLPASFASYSSDDLLPQNAIFLFNDAGTQTYHGLTYRYRDQTSFYVSGSPLVTGNGYRVLAPGANVNEVVGNLSYLMERHRHAGPRAIVHNNCVGRGYQQDLYLYAATNYGWCRAQSHSLIPGNDHPQYLMRNGFSLGFDNESLDNVMMGDIGFGYAMGNYTTATTVVGTSFAEDANGYGPSWGLFWGDTDLGASLRLDTDYHGSGFVKFLSPEMSFFHGNYDSFTTLTEGVGVRNNINSFGTAHDLFIVGNENNLSVYASTATALLSFPVHCDVSVVGAKQNLMLGDSTNCSVSLTGEEVRCTATGDSNCSISVNGSDIGLVATSVGQGFRAIVSGAGENITVPVTDTDLSMNFAHWHKATNITLEPSMKLHQYGLNPNMWRNVDAGGGPGTANAVYDWTTEEEMEIIATGGVGDSMFAFLRLPTDGQMHDIALTVALDDANISLWNCPEDEYYVKVLTTDISYGGNKTSVTFDLSALSLGRRGWRYPTFGNTAIDVMIRIENQSGDKGMTAFMSHYTVNRKRW